MACNRVESTKIIYFWRCLAYNGRLTERRGSSLADSSLRVLQHRYNSAIDAEIRHVWIHTLQWVGLSATYKSCEVSVYRT